MTHTIQQSKTNRLPSSLRDPAGFLFEHEDNLYRTVNYSHKEGFDLLLSSGLYEHLASKEILIEHQEASSQFALTELDAYQVLKVKRLPFISYSYEWCFSQLKTAAIFTLELQKIALEYGLTLKDASAFNIQYRGSMPIFIDTLSFEKYQNGSPWAAYEQFCRHFLAPLALMSYRDDRLHKLLRIYMDGIPLDLAFALLPFKSYFNLSLLFNLILQAKAQDWFSRSVQTKTVVPTIEKHQLLALIDNLQTLIEGLKVRKRSSIWKTYYEDACIYSDQAMISKQQIIEGCIDNANPKIVWDLGANDGKFSRIASAKNIFTLSIDLDHNSVENNFLAAHKNNDVYLHPLLMDIVNPSPAQGWASCETKSLIERGTAETLLALALIHHLVITHSLSLSSVAAFFASMCKTLIVEFIPENDPQVQRLLNSVPDPLFNKRYNIEIFEKEFKNHFAILDRLNIEDCQRLLYFAKKM